jgi:DNA-binding NarL/FixJ family response regulator
MKMRINVLIVDDEPEFRANLQTTIENANYQAVTAGNKVEAKECIRLMKPDLVILGTLAPRGDAFLLHQWIKHTPNSNKIPLIVIDASSEKQLTKGWTKDEGLRLEAEDYFRKPIEPTALLGYMEKQLDKATKKIKVLVADDHAVVREGIRSLLSLQRDIQVVGEAMDGRDALDKTLRLLPDVILMDIIMPGMNGIEATKAICKEYKKARVLMLTQYDDDENIFASDQAGAIGFIPKKSASSHLVAGIRSANRGESFSVTMG